MTDNGFSLVFETHSTSLDNEAGLASGWSDVDLSSTGEEQARQLGVRWAGEPFAAVFCSDLNRAYRTGEIAFGQRGASIVRDARLRECNYGVLTRSPASRIDACRLRYVDLPFPEGESYQQVVERVRSFLDEVAGREDNRSVLVIGHRATFFALEHLINATPLRQVIASPWNWRPGWKYELRRRNF